MFTLWVQSSATPAQAQTKSETEKSTAAERRAQLTNPPARYPLIISPQSFPPAVVLANCKPQTAVTQINKTTISKTARVRNSLSSASKARTTGAASTPPAMWPLAPKAPLSARENFSPMIYKANAHPLHTASPVTALRRNRRRHYIYQTATQPHDQRSQPNDFVKRIINKNGPGEH